MAPLRRGVHRPLEDEADRLIRESLKGVTKRHEKADILTPWKEAMRHQREVYVATGAPDPAIRRGMYHRSANAARPDLNSREGIARSRSGVAGSLATFAQEHGVTTE